MNFSKTESALIERIQKGIPIMDRPFARIAHELGSDESVVIESIDRFKAARLIRSVAGIFSPDRLGYSISLVAFRVPAADIERAAAAINAHPGVSHNYLRDHEYNVWFTLAVLPDTSLEGTVSSLSEEAGARDALILKNERLLKIGLMLSVGEGGGGDDAAPRAIDARAPRPLAGREISAVRLLQEDCPLVPRPFHRLAEDSDAGLSGPELIALANGLRADGIMRRYAAVLRHRDAGYAANAMTVWRPSDAEKSGPWQDVFIAERAISHLYLRTVFPGRWEYPLFAMIHAHGDEELDRIIAGLAARSGIADYRILRSLREFKKQRVRYFSDSFEEWDRIHIRSDV